jgi:hypothetical protein
VPDYPERRLRCRFDRLGGQGVLLKPELDAAARQARQTYVPGHLNQRAHPLAAQALEPVVRAAAPVH